MKEIEDRHDDPLSPSSYIQDRRHPFVLRQSGQDTILSRNLSSRLSTQDLNPRCDGIHGIILGQKGQGQLQGRSAG